MVEKNEKIKIYNHMAEFIGIADRELANTVGLWHFCSQVWVLMRSTDPQQSIVVFQQRSKNKAIGSNLLDISASGHVNVNSDTLNTARDELASELGLFAQINELVYLGRRIDMYETSGILSRIFADNYIYIIPEPQEKIPYNEKEIEALFFLPLTKGLQLFSGNTDCVSVRKQKGDVITEAKISMNDFIPRQDNFYLNGLIAIERLLDGKKIFSI